MTFTHKLLAVNFGGIGDEVLFLPTLQSIRSHYPDWHITLLLEPRSKSISQITDLIDATIEFDIKKRPLMVADLLDLLNLIKSGGYDTVLSSGSSPLVSVLLFLSGINNRIGYKSNKLSELLLTKSIPLNKNQYAASMYHDLVLGLGISEPADNPKILTKSENIQHMQSALFSDATISGEASASKSQTTKKRILIHPGTSKLAIAKGIIKTWSPENWAQLISKLSQHPQIEVILAGGPDDHETVKAIQSKLEGKSYKSAVGLTKSLSDLAALMNLCDLLICVDSAPMHLAVGLNKSLVALFGPTKSELLLPKNNFFIALQNNNNSMPTSSKTGVNIEPASVYQAAMNLLKL